MTELSAVPFEKLPPTGDGYTVLYDNNQVCRSDKKLSELVGARTSSFLTKEEGDSLYQEKGDYLVEDDITGKLDTTEFSTVSGNFLTAHQVIPSGKWENVSDVVIANSATWGTETDWTDDINAASANALSEAKNWVEEQNYITGVDLTKYYTKSETSGKEEIANALTAKQNVIQSKKNSSLPYLETSNSEPSWEVIESEQINAHGTAQEGEVYNTTINGRAYTMVCLNGKLWLAENYVDSTKASYTDSKYGSYFTEATIKLPTFVPQGWHLPSKEEYQGLIDYTENHEKYLATTDWHTLDYQGNPDPNYIAGTNELKLNILPGGEYNEYTGPIYQEHYYTWLWTSTDETSSQSTGKQRVYVQISNYIGDGISKIISFLKVGPGSNRYYTVRLIKDDLDVSGPDCSYASSAGVETLNTYYALTTTGWKDIAEGFYDKTTINNSLNSKQDNLTFAGENNTITSINNSAIGGGSVGGVVGAYVPLSALECTIGSGNSAISGSLAHGENNLAGCIIVHPEEIVEGELEPERTEVLGYSFAQGKENSAYGYSITQGDSNVARYYAMAQGMHNEANYYSMAQGLQNVAESQSFAHGNNNSASQTSFTQGEYNYAYGKGVCFGYQNSATMYSFTQGETVTARNYSFAAGKYNYAENYSQTFGYGLKATNYTTAQGYEYAIITLGSFVIGEFNKTSAAPFVIGNGTSDNDRKDLFVVDKDGNVSAQGQIYAEGGVLGASLDTLELAPDNETIEFKTSSHNVVNGEGEPEEYTVIKVASGLLNKINELYNLVSSYSGNWNLPQ